MPNVDTGLTGTEILEFIRNYIGNQSSSFTNFLTTALPLAEFRFCKAHDWAFLNKKNLALTVASGTSAYNLTVSTIGYYMPAAGIRSIFNPASGTHLTRTSLEEIRRMNPSNDAGSTSQNITHWAPVGDNEVVFYPPNFSDTELRIDGEISPVALLILSNYPTIPYRYQESFLEYLKAIALDRENDDRANNQRQYSLGLIRADIQNDLESLSDNDEPRMKAPWEQNTGATSDLNQLYDLFAFYG